MKLFTLKILMSAGLLLIAVLAWLWHSRDDMESVINRRLDEAVVLVERTGDESPFLVIGQARELVNYLAAEPVVSVGSPFPELRDRQELVALVAQARQTVNRLTVRVYDRRVEVYDDGRSAVMEFVAVVTATYGGEQRRENRHLRLEWILEEGEWVVAKAELLDGKRNLPLF